MSSKYAIGIVGSGGIAHAHGNACNALDEAHIAAVCDVNREAVDRFGETFNVKPRYTSIDTMLAEIDLDIAIIGTWGHTHAEVSNALARSGKVRAILCEKPFCKDASEAEEMINTAKENGVLLAEAFKFRHHPQHLKMKQIIDVGDLGNLHTIRSTFLAGPVPIAHLHPDVNWRFNKSKGGGSIYDLGCYCIHHARFISGSEPERVFAIGHVGEVTEVDEMVSAVMEFPGEVTASINVGFRSYGSQTVEIYGDNGRMWCEKAWNNENQPVTVHVHYKNGDHDTYDFAALDQFALQLRHLMDCLEGKTTHRIPPENTISQMWVIDALFNSIATNQPVVP